MNYIFNRLRTFFNIKIILYILLLSILLSLVVNYINSASSTIEIQVIDEDHTKASRRLFEKIVSIDGFSEKESSRQYIILKGFEEKIDSRNYKQLIDFTNIDSFELEKANLKIIQLVTENKVLEEIRKEDSNYSYADYYKDLKTADSFELVHITDNPREASTDITDKKQVYLFISIILFIFIANLYVNTEIIEERRKLIIERLLINGITRRYYYVEKFIKILIIDILFILPLLLITSSINMVSIVLFLSVVELYGYSILLHLLKLDKNTYIVLYMILFIIFAILYIIPGFGIHYFSPIELIGTY